MTTILYKKAKAEDCNLLTETAISAKKYWGYADELIRQWIDLLTITEDNLQRGQVYKCFAEEEYIGFFALVPKGNYILVEHLWLLPEFLNKGYGTQTIKEIKRISKEEGFKYIEVFAEPNTNEFYEKMGAECVRTVLTTVPGRMMSVFHLPVVAEPWQDLPTVGLVVLEKQRLLLAYSNNKKAWYLPGGKVDNGEDSKTALIREIEEELAVSLNPDKLKHLVPISAPAYGEKLNIMMRQECFLYELEDEKIQATNEIGAIKYFSFEEYRKEAILVPGVLMVYEFLKKNKMI